MEHFVVEGCNRLQGELLMQGSKNSALPILAATILYGGESILHNCPNLSDIDAAVKILKYLGCTVIRDNNTIII
ncbi:MAG: UDP-N-acetylglucosamine 1-carboxyvinyltransferase, partial [Oscillospiraceae bacterium]